MSKAAPFASPLTGTKPAAPQQVQPATPTNLFGSRRMSLKDVVRAADKAQAVQEATKDVAKRETIWRNLSIAFCILSVCSAILPLWMTAVLVFFAVVLLAATRPEKMHG